MNKLQELREALITGKVDMNSRYGRSASSLMDHNTLDSLIVSKQRQIFRLVAESADSNLIRQRQRELDQLVEAKNNNKREGKSGAALQRPISLREFRKIILSA